MRHQTARWIHDRSHLSGIPIIAEANVAFGYTWRVWHSDQLKIPGMHQLSREWERSVFTIVILELPLHTCLEPGSNFLRSWATKRLLMVVFKYFGTPRRVIF